MHFITFPVASTNIFPLVNSTHGGQLVTEYNLKAREMVATNPDVKYPIGPSFLHSSDDFKVKLLENSDVPPYSNTKTYNKGDYCSYNNDTYVCIVKITTPESFNPNHWAKTVISNSILQIDPGRAVINGHYVESLAPMMIDLNAVNAELRQQQQDPLYGNLSIGIKTYFSTENTMSGSMLVENTDNMYVGVQLVIERSSAFTTPNDVPDASQEGIATADLKLADFVYINGVVASSSIALNPDATKYIPAQRIVDFNLDDRYASFDDLVDKLFYTCSGSSGWCDSTGSIMIWDSHSEDSWGTTPPPAGLDEAKFIQDDNGEVHFVIPHKQPDAEIYNDQGQRMYYAPKDIKLPSANYATNSAGVVTSEYTQYIKNLANTVNTYKAFTNGKQIAYWETLSADSKGNLNHDFPSDLSSYNVGDYILVREDFTTSNNADLGAAPSTMYFAIPGGVTSIAWNGTNKPSGFRLAEPVVLWEGEGATQPTSSSPNAEELKEMFGYDTYSGVNNDYFEIQFHDRNDEHTTSYYYKVTGTSPKLWSAPVLLNGGIPLATNVQVGGFYNITSDSAYTDAGYVYLDESGHLRLMDYGLLRTGALAYQLGADVTVPAKMTRDYVQNYLDEYVNARVAFKVVDTSADLSTNSTMVNVTIPLPEEGVLNIYNIDSRFNTGVYLHFTTDDTSKNYSNVVINILDCQKVRIDSSITTWTSGPVINIFRSCLYYDVPVINYIKTCDVSVPSVRETLFPDYVGYTGFDNLSLWYAKFKSNDPDLTVNGMEVMLPEADLTPQEISFWSTTVPGDNHYFYALRSVSLSTSGIIIGFSLYVSNGSTRQTLEPGHTIIGGSFVLPQGASLNYPQTCITHPLKVTGTFTTAYQDSTHTKWITTDTSFTALTGTYDSDLGMQKGSIAFNSNTYMVDTTYTNVATIDGWDVGTYHIFYGGTTV